MANFEWVSLSDYWYASMVFTCGKIAKALEESDNRELDEAINNLASQGYAWLYRLFTNKNDLDHMIFERKSKYADHWSDKSQSYWFQRVMQEMGELASVLAGDHDDTIEWEVSQIVTICMNWRDHRKNRGFHFNGLM